MLKTVQVHIKVENFTGTYKTLQRDNVSVMVSYP